jgi:catechol 2,3-dioxygenase
VIIPYARLSHLGILVKDLDKMIDFYCRIIGLTLSDRGKPSGGPGVNQEYAFLSRDPMEHHQVVLVTGRNPDVPSQIVQMSFEMGSLPDLRAVHDLIKKDKDVTNIQTRAHGIAWSLYFDDPEQNILEMFVATPWYVPAPSVIPFDFSMTNEQIFTHVGEEAKKRPGYKPHNTWREEAEKRMLMAGVWPGPRI